MIIYGHGVSPFVQRCFVVADMKGQFDAMTLALVPDGLHSDAHKAANPLGKIPYLEMADGSVLVESAAIAAYLDMVLDGPPLAGDSAEDRARVQMMAALVDGYFGRGFERLWPGRADEETVQRVVSDDMQKAMDALEHFASDTGFLVGNALTLADAALIPWLFHLRVFGKKVGLPDFGDRPKLAAWQANMSKQDVAKGAFERASTALRDMG